MVKHNSAKALGVMQRLGNRQQLQPCECAVDSLTADRSWETPGATKSRVQGTQGIQRGLYLRETWRHCARARLAHVSQTLDLAQPPWHC